MQLYLLRHAQSEGNATGSYTVDTVNTLSALGKRQAQELAERLAHLDFDRVYCSPLPRALGSIRPFALRAEIDVEVWPELAEGCWRPPTPGATAASWRSTPSDAVPDGDPCFLWRDGKQIRPVEDETYEEGLVRLREAVALLLKRHKGTEDRVLVVTHGHALSRLIALLLGLEPGAAMFNHANTGITKLTDEGAGTLEVAYINRLSGVD